MGETLRAWWSWFEGRMRSPYAPVFLFVYSFVETLITLIPIDPFALAAMVADKKRAYFTAVYIVLGSLSGALVGYWIGHFAYAHWAPTLLGGAVAQATLTKFQHIWFQHEFLITFTTAFAPIFKTPTILAAGVFNGNIVTYIIAWALGRSLHFSAEALIVQLSVSHSVSRAMRALSVLSIIFLLGVLAYIALSYSGLA